MAVQQALVLPQLALGVLFRLGEGRLLVIVPLLAGRAQPALSA
ncbi:hypothetical protein AB3662_12165 [Sorangium cellulosum]